MAAADVPRAGRVLITGGGGFVGSHLAEALLHMGRHVTVLDDFSTGRMGNIERLEQNPNFDVVVDDVSNPVALDRLASESGVIFHLAASVGVKLIIDNPIRTVENNVLGTQAVLRAALRYRTKVLLASTSEVYGKGARVPFAEEDDVVLGPTSQSRWGYAMSKMIDEVLALAHHRAMGLPVVVFRLFNTVGPRQTGRYGMVIPRFVEAALQGRPLEVYGDGQQSRCFVHVLDAVDAIMRLAECPDAIGRVFNIGHTQEISMHDLARRVVSLVSPLAGVGNGAGTVTDGRGASSASFDVTLTNEHPIVFVPYGRAYGPGFEDLRRRVPDISRIRAATGWQPRRNLDDIICDVAADLRPRMAAVQVAAPGQETTVALGSVDVRVEEITTSAAPVRVPAAVPVA